MSGMRAVLYKEGSNRKGAAGPPDVEKDQQIP